MPVKLDKTFRLADLITIFVIVITALSFFLTLRNDVNLNKTHSVENRGRIDRLFNYQDITGSVMSAHTTQLAETQRDISNMRSTDVEIKASLLRMEVKIDEL